MLYNLNRLVYVEVFNNPNEGILREKQLKGWSRKKKIELIKTINPKVEDISDKIML
jgi:putative endonuclease